MVVPKRNANGANARSSKQTLNALCPIGWRETQDIVANRKNVAGTKGLGWLRNQVSKSGKPPNLPTRPLGTNVGVATIEAARLA
jgi:hypothetical protein